MSVAGVIARTLGGGEKWEPTIGRTDVACMLGAGDCASAALLAGLTSARPQRRGWEATLGATLSYLDIERVDDQTVDVAIDAKYASYFITEPETLALAIPAAALAAGFVSGASAALAIGVNATLSLIHI